MESLGWRRTNFRPGVAAIIGGALAFVISGIATLLGTPKVESPIEQFTNSPLSLAAIAIMAVTVAPLFEELLFRGFLQPLFSRTFGITIGIVLTAVLFGALHLPEYSSVWQYGLAVSIVGVVLGYIRERTQSVIPGTIMHACYNSIFVIALVASKFAKTK
jgi:membrane protease YdiL (CAAX protease family)